MKKKIFILLSVLFVLATLSACGTASSSASASYTKISASEAKKIMDENSNVVILDVRTKEEYDSGHIKGALLLPDTEVLENAAELLPDPSATILVYCRSGRRSELAAKDLVSLGYSNVSDFGGIIDWNYEVVTE